MAQTTCQHTADVLGGQSQTLREMETELLFLYIILGAMIVLTLSVFVWAFYMLRERRIVVAKNRELLRMKNDESIPLVVEKRRDPQQEELFVTIDTAIRQERLYADVALQRQDVCDRFGINRHALNELLVQYAEGLSFPQYVNDIRLQEALRLLHNENGEAEKTISEIASSVGFTPANLREQFKRVYGMTPVEYRQSL